MKSILQTEHKCYICGSQVWLEEHHVFGGHLRKFSEKYGLKVYLCHWCHNEPPGGVHFNAKKMAALRSDAQKKAMEHYGWSEDDFRSYTGRSYLQEEQ